MKKQKSRQIIFNLRHLSMKMKATVIIHEHGYLLQWNCVYYIYTYKYNVCTDAALHEKLAPTHSLYFFQHLFIHPFNLAPYS